MRSVIFLFFVAAMFCAGIFVVFNGCDREKVPTSSETPDDAGP